MGVEALYCGDLSRQVVKDVDGVLSCGGHDAVEGEEFFAEDEVILGVDCLEWVD